jgi:glycosyltransferase involved in cell wall biosynthesis
MYYTGTEKFVLNMAKAQQKFGETVKILTYSFYDASFYTDKFGDNIVYKTFAYSGVEVCAWKLIDFPIEIHGMVNFPNNPEILSFADFIFDAFKPDVIHVGHLMRKGSFIERAIERHIPYIWTLTDFWMFCHKGIMITDSGEVCEGCDECRKCGECAGFMPEQKIERYKISRRLLENARALFSPSQFLADMYNKEFPGLHVRTHHHGMNFSHLIRKSKKYSNSDSEPIIFSFMGTLLKHKGAHLIIEAINRIPKANLKVQIWGSGSSDYIDELKNAADERVSFHGTYNEKEVGKVLSGVDVVIIPSMWYENYPLVMHEAFASFMPVLGTALGGMSEKIKDGVNGWTFPFGDSTRLSEIMQDMCDNREQINAYQHYLQRFFIPTVEQEAWGYWEFYKAGMTL